MVKRLGLWAFLLAGVAVAVWGVASYIAPSTSCRGVEMGPGDVCELSKRTVELSGEVQLYEDRIEVTRQQAPFAVAAGLAMAAFGGVLIRQRPAARAQGSSDIGP